MKEKQGGTSKKNVTCCGGWGQQVDFGKGDNRQSHCWVWVPLAPRTGLCWHRSDSAAEETESFSEPWPGFESRLVSCVISVMCCDGANSVFLLSGLFSAPQSGLCWDGAARAGWQEGPD